MRTCQITSVHNRYDARIYRKIAVSLAKNGYESFLLCCDSLGNEIKENVHFVSIPFKAKNRIQRIIKSWKKLKKPALSIDADIYQLHDPELIPLGTYLKKHGKKVIFDSHEDYKNITEKQWIPKIFRKLFTKIYLNYEKKHLSKFDGVISVTPYIVNRLKLINKNTAMITNYPILFPSYVHEFNNPFLCFGGNTKYKHKEIIDAINLLDMNVRYEFVTDIKSESFQELKKSCSFEKVDAFDLMPFEKLREIYKSCSIGMVLYPYSINCNWKEGSYGVIKLFEIMAEGMPVICTDFDIWVAIIDKYKCGIYVNPNDVNAIKNAISDLLTNKNKLIEMGRNARKAVEGEFNWSTQEKKLLDFYKRILDSNNGKI